MKQAALVMGLGPCSAAVPRLLLLLFVGLAGSRTSLAARAASDLVEVSRRGRGVDVENDPVSACSCECCEVEEQRSDANEIEGPMRLQCALSQAPVFYNQQSRTRVQPVCGSLCNRARGDQILKAAETPEVDTQRFCFFECEPRVPDSQNSDGSSKAPGIGDGCEPLPRKLDGKIRDKSGNALPPMERPGAMSHFLVMRSARHGQQMTQQRQLQANMGALRMDALSGAPAGAPSAAPGGAPEGILKTEPVDPWSSVDAEQSARATEWAQEAQAKVEEASADAELVDKIEAKVQAGVPDAMMAVEAAKEASREAAAAEAKVRGIDINMQKVAHEVAFGEIKGIIEELTKKERAKAQKDAMKKGKEMKDKMLEEAPVAAAAAMVPYEDALKAAAKTAGEYGKSGDAMAGQAASLQMKAAIIQSTANQWMNVGLVPKAQKMMQESRKLLGIASGLSASAGAAYGTAQAVMATLPAYTAEAGAAAYRAEVMLNPDAPPPPPGISLLQKPRTETVEVSTHPQKHQSSQTLLRGTDGH